MSERIVLHHFFFNHTATTDIYTLSLHDALPISRRPSTESPRCASSVSGSPSTTSAPATPRDRKSTRLNSSHVENSYAVFCLKKKKKKKTITKQTKKKTNKKKQNKKK